MFSALILGCKDYKSSSADMSIEAVAPAEEVAAPTQMSIPEKNRDMKAPSPQNLVAQEQKIIREANLRFEATTLMKPTIVFVWQ